MALSNSSVLWGSGARSLHWLMAILIVVLGIVGLYMAGLPNSPDKIRIYAIHKSVGLTVLALAILRLLWRLGNRRPTDLPMPAWQAWSAHAVHGLLYVLMFALPLSGWLYNSASGYPLQWFWTVQLPSLTGGADPALKPIAHAIHEWGFYVLGALVIAHAGAALRHHFVDRDETLLRMLPGLRRFRAEPPATTSSSLPNIEKHPSATATIPENKP
ncbi:MAG: cytochrome b [Tahibacter sp.]